MEIVYCGGCGKVLREDEFTKGQARFLDNRPWCVECKPPDKSPIPSSTASIKKAGSSAKLPRINPGTTRREVPGISSNKPLFIGLGVAGGGLLLLGIFMASGSAPSAPPVLPDKPARSGSLPPSQNPASAEAERLLKELEAVASLSPPDKILARCEEIRSRLRGTPLEKRFKEIEASALEQKKSRDQDGQFARESDAIRKLIEDDPRFAKGDEALRRLRALKEIAGSRSGEVDRRLADYQKARQESPHEKHAGPFSTDDDGFIRNWLLLGVFPSDKDKGIDTDFLNGEAVHDPVDGLTVGKLKWSAYASTEAKVDFFKATPLGLKSPKDNVVAYAACLVQVPVQVAAEVRLGSDDGFALWVDGAPVGKVHKPRKLMTDEDRIAVALSPGVHRVLLKVEQHSRNFEFILRILGPDGQRVPQLRVWN
jgi:hypothetical protein